MKIHHSLGLMLAFAFTTIAGLTVKESQTIRSMTNRLSLTSIYQLMGHLLRFINHPTSFYLSKGIQLLDPQTPKERTIIEKTEEHLQKHKNTYMIGVGIALMSVVWKYIKPQQKSFLTIEYNPPPTTDLPGKEHIMNLSPTTDLPGKEHIMKVLSDHLSSGKKYIYDTFHHSKHALFKSRIAFAHILMAPEILAFKNKNPKYITVNDGMNIWVREKMYTQYKIHHYVNLATKHIKLQDAQNMPIVKTLLFLHWVHKYLYYGFHKEQTCTYESDKHNIIINLLLSNKCNCVCATSYLLAACEEFDYTCARSCNEPRHIKIGLANQNDKIVALIEPTDPENPIRWILEDIKADVLDGIAQAHKTNVVSERDPFRNILSIHGSPTLTIDKKIDACLKLLPFSYSILSTILSSVYWVESYRKNETNRSLLARNLNEVYRTRIFTIFMNDKIQHSSIPKEDLSMIAQNFVHLFGSWKETAPLIQTLITSKQSLFDTSDQWSWLADRMTGLLMSERAFSLIVEFGKDQLHLSKHSQGQVEAPYILTYSLCKVIIYPGDILMIKVYKSLPIFFFIEKLIRDNSGLDTYEGITWSHSSEVCKNQPARVTIYCSFRFSVDTTHILRYTGPYQNQLKEYITGTDFFVNVGSKCTNNYQELYHLLWFHMGLATDPELQKNKRDKENPPPPLNRPRAKTRIHLPPSYEEGKFKNIPPDWGVMEVKTNGWERTVTHIVEPYAQIFPTT